MAPALSGLPRQINSNTNNTGNTLQIGIQSASQTKHQDNEIADVQTDKEVAINSWGSKLNWRFWFWLCVYIIAEVL